MATVTSGLLLKLLQSVNNPDAPRLTGDHRSAVLQVTGIVPVSSLSPDDGFYLQLSDSLHSTYVSPPSGSSADSFRLGQLIHLDRLVPSYPVPLASSIKPIPFLSRSPPPILGHPEPLLALSSPSDPNSFLIQHSSAVPPPPPPKKITINPSPPPAPPIKKRFSSPAPAKTRQPSPAAAAKRASSPVPSKCAVPGLMQAREENRRSSREPAIVVPSRYRQPSPVAAGSGRRGSVSPAARRLSRGASPGTTGPGEKRRSGVVVAGISRVSDSIVGSGRSMRKSWEDPGTGNSGDAKDKSGSGGGGVGSSRSKVDPQAILRTQVAISRRLSDVGKEQNIIEDSSTNAKQKPGNKIEPPPLSEKLNGSALKVPVHDRKWTDGSIPFDAVSDNLARLGKEAFQRRNVASIAAAEALEEALSVEALIRNLSMFSDLCSTSKAGNPLPTIDDFLSIYNDVMKWIAITESLVSSRSTSGPNESMLIDRSKPASLWVDAALATDLEVLSLVNSDGFPMQKHSYKPSILYVDPPRVNFSRKNSLGTPAKGQVKVPNNVWTRGHGLDETLNAAKFLRQEMQSWFLKFVEDALDVGFRLFSNSLEDGKDNGGVAAVLSHLKRVNEWLDGVGKKPEEGMTMVVEKIERLKRKIYGFVITHVGSAFDSSMSLSKA